MNIAERFKAIGEYGAAGLYEEPERGLFYRKALGLRRFYENCALAPYEGKRLYPSGTWDKGMKITPSFLLGLDGCAEDEKLQERFLADFKQSFNFIPEEHTVAGAIFTHSMPHYERVLKEGFCGYAERVKKLEDEDMREGLLHLVEGIRAYTERCVAYLKSVSADEELIAALERVPMQPARNLYEAIVGWNFVLYLDGCDNLGCVASGLYPYYKGEDVTELLGNLFDNLDENCGYSMALGTDYNPLTLQCLEASKGRRRPMIELFVNEDTPQEIWDKAFEVIRTHNGQPAFYNEKDLLGGLKRRFPSIRDEDLKRFCGGGCTESMIAGLSNVGSLDAGINLALILTQIIKEKLPSAKSFEEFYDAYMAEVSAVVNRVTDAINYSRQEREKRNPLPMRTLLIDDCIDKGTEYNSGGARYSWSIINFAGVINVIDSLLVIRDFVFRDGLYSGAEVAALLKADDEEFIKRCKEHSLSFGTDHEEANAMASRLSTDVFSLTEGKELYKGEGFLAASIQFNQAAVAGEKVSATPDGRRSGTPLAESLGAIFAKDTQGPTALLKSVTSLALDRALGIPVLNFTINPEIDNKVLQSLILGYIQLGGIQMQITCTDKKMLMEAYENPEMHKNLVVRVGGYSEYFYRLSDELKRLIITRMIHE